MVLPFRPINYLLVGHVTQDITSEGVRLGGTVAYAGLTAHALGRKVGILTAAASDLDLQPFEKLQVLRMDSTASSTFQNRYVGAERQQRIIARAGELRFEMLPEAWSSVKLLHCGPVADEVETSVTTRVSCEQLCLTPQGWLRQWDEQGAISLKSWDTIRSLLTPSSIVVLSREDLGGTLKHAGEIAAACKILAITLGVDGCMVYAAGEQRHLQASGVTEVDPTGCGDIFAAVFFICLEQGDGPWTAGAIANRLAGRAATRRGLASIPNHEEIHDAFQLRLA
jgi:sugar/nucleoside kinase (ribokinase family)